MNATSLLRLREQLVMKKGHAQRAIGTGCQFKTNTYKQSLRE